MEDKTLANLTMRIKQSDQKNTVQLSNTLTGIQNAFNKILTYSKNMNRIQEAKLEDTALYSKEAQLEAPKATPLAAAPIVSPDTSALVKLIPDLIKVVKKLGNEVEDLDLTGSGSAMPDISSVLPGPGTALKAGAMAAAGAAVLAYTLSEDEPEPTPKVMPVVDDTQPASEPPAQVEQAKRKSQQQDEKLVKAATKAATVQAKPVKKEEPTKAVSNQGNQWTNKVSAFIGDTYRNVTSFMGGFLAKLASLGSQLGDFLSGGAQNLAGLFGFGGGAGFQEANLSGAKGEWARDSSFIGGVNALAKKYDVDAGDLLGLMWSESGLNPQARNASGGATGLIQFMPDTARALGTTTDAIYRMNRTQQLTLVDRFFQMSKLPQGATAGQLYATVFLPAYNRKADNFVVARANGANDAGKVQPKWYSQNAGLDTNRDGAITIADLGGRISKKRQEIGLGPSRAGSGFRALGNLATGAVSGLAGLAGDVGTFVGDVGSYISNSIFGTASKFLGLDENQGAPALNQFVGRYFQQGFNVKRTPWCAAFANSVLGSQGIKGTGSAAAISFRTFGGLVWDRQAGGNLQAAAKGDIAVFRRPQGTGHVAFVDSINLKAGTITYVGGNQSDRTSGGQVSRSTIKIDNPTNGLIAIRRPSGGNPARPETRPASSMPQTSASLAIDKKKQAQRGGTTRAGTPGQRRGIAQASGRGNRPQQPQKKSAMDQFLGYFNAG